MDFLCGRAQGQWGGGKRRKERRGEEKGWGVVYKAVITQKKKILAAHTKNVVSEVSYMVVFV